MEDKNIKPLVQKLLGKILFLELAVLAVLIALAMAAVRNFKGEMAANIADAFRTPLIVGDNRYIVMEMPGPALKYFSGVTWEPPQRASRFSIPSDLGEPDGLLYGRLTVPLFSDEGMTAPAGRLHFYYNRWTFAGWAAGAWLCFLLGSLPLVLKEKNRLVRDYRLMMELEVKKSLAAVTAQVAHDIRSPLAALDMAVKSSAHIPEEQRVILRSAASRIRDIANDLLQKNRGAKPGAAGDPAGVWLLSCLIDPLVTEKRLQFRSRPGIAINCEPDADSYGLFAKVQPAEFKRVISNLVNNAAEALGDSGTVAIGLARCASGLEITVADDGKGIPPEVLRKLGEAGYTHGKTGGSGLGLYHARRAVEGWGGELKIASEPGKGAIVTVTLPAALPPAWFTARLELPERSPVVILDDDDSIHQLWRGRLEAARGKDRGVEEYHFSAPDELRSWVKGNPAKAAAAVCLFDYELLGWKETGLSLAEELALCPHVILVTSHYEEPGVVEECVRLKVRLLPKGLSGLIPIAIVEAGAPSGDAAQAPAPPPDAVLLDDDRLVHMTWKMAAREKGLNLKIYDTAAGLLAGSGELPPATAIYIDSDLGDGGKGEDVARVLHDKGFTNLSMETGHSPDRFAHLTFLRSVQSKRPPWQ
ncbi:MAG TPA: ATP-binding protein [Elusimicrobiales bacterium]|nr:ATP-binding protein [Elusimicrobiales bacterium]